ncbi:MAG: FAD-dependent oxidoreductase [Candidatus Latescibacteria bacterium]|nr:FAD-dependent oxidoreductase [Candidatus Latescibacterota bacterium]
MPDPIFSKVLIIGAGPSGAFLAYLLAHQGIEVLLVDKAFLSPRKSMWRRADIGQPSGS